MDKVRPVTYSGERSASAELVSWRRFSKERASMVPVGSVSEMPKFDWRYLWSTLTRFSPAELVGAIFCALFRSQVNFGRKAASSIGTPNSPISFSAWDTAMSMLLRRAISTHCLMVII